MRQYNHQKIEPKWQKEWERKKIYKTLPALKAQSLKLKPFYVLDMFPYPSGAGLHVGHPRGYIGSDVYARLKRMQGYNVLHPMGYDAFGLPAEQYALEHKVHPSVAVKKNVATFERQLSIIGLSYDWSRKINTTDPEYYKWTQWIFLQLYNSYYDQKLNKARPISELIKKFEKENKDWENYDELKKQEILMNYRLAYEGESEVNWCQGLGTVLANDEIVDDPHGHPISERGGFGVEKIKIKQWFLRITAYADRLLLGLEGLKWSNHLKEIQKNWIGQSQGSEIEFKIKNSEEKIKVFTTRADTLFGCTYIVLAPEYPLIENWKLKIKNWSEVEEYINKAKHKTQEERVDAKKEKSGVKLGGLTAINRANNEEIPVWISDYVLADYGTGAIMAVPAHDERDHAFAQKYNLPIHDRPLVNKEEITKKVGGKFVTKYKMRDAVFARQRYWGEPIPLWRDKIGLIHEVKKLPLKLPNVKSYEPTGEAEGPLAGVKTWTAKGYETNTMPGWAGSSWYYLAYMMREISNFQFPISKYKDIFKYFRQVDVYIGGVEHATGHLLYARFWHKFLYDIGVVQTEEPFLELHNQGMIIAADGRRMSKRWGNVVNPDDIVRTYGADTLRVYEMFMGPFTDSIAWSTESIIGSRRFLEKVWRIGQQFSNKSQIQNSKENNTNILQNSGIEKLLHKTIKKVTEDIENFHFNTAISSLMILMNEVEKNIKLLKIENWVLVIKLLSPFAPHLAEELYQQLRIKDKGLRISSIHLSDWPEWNPKLIIDEIVKIVVQINSKVRTQIEIEMTINQEELKEIVLKNEVVQKWLENKPIKKFIYVKNKLVNIVI